MQKESSPVSQVSVSVVLRLKHRELDTIIQVLTNDIHESSCSLQHKLGINWICVLTRSPGTIVRSNQVIAYTSSILQFTYYRIGVAERYCVHEFNHYMIPNSTRIPVKCFLVPPHLVCPV